MKRAILFDLDGTLIDSAPDLGDALNFALNRLGLPTYDLETIRSWIGNGARELVRRGIAGSFEAKDVDEKLLQEALELFFAHYEHNLCRKTRCYDEVPSTLQELSHFRLAIVTNKPLRFVAPILEELGIDHHFDLILGGDSLEVKKPHPQPLLHACKQLGVAPKDAVMVGDSINDIQAARSAKIESIAVRWGYNGGRPLDADHLIDRFSELKELV